MASSSGSTKVCFNSTCKEALDVPRQGWLCRTGDFADLCDRCSSAFKDGKFCDTYHLNASGWRCCESCGKQIHCGCIVSFHMFILLDAGGIECINCAKSEYILTPNPTWPSSSHFQTGPTEKIRDQISKNWKSINPVPWKQSPTLFNSSTIDKQLTSCSLTSLTKPSTNHPSDSWRVGPPQTTGVQYNDGGQQHNLFQSFFTNELATPISSLPATFMPQDQNIEKGKVSGVGIGRLCPPPSVGKCCSSNSSPPGTSLESQTHGAKSQSEKRGRHQLLPRYWPRLTDQELQQISGGSNAKITPLFEKVLSASDAGRIGRLVLPKKCAEAYLPPISQPEGYPLVVQDLKGKDWVLQFRFWPNNNSRMYVLEGVTPCIQSMQLQAGDTVTFSRLEPEGKLVMGFRKASPLVNSTHEEPPKGSFGNKFGTWPEGNNNNNKRKKGGGKKVKLNNEELIQVKLNVTLEQVQGLFRPPPVTTSSPSITLIEGVEFEHFQEEPIIGTPEQSPGGTNHKPPCTQVGNLLYADIIRYTQAGPAPGVEKVNQSFKSQNIDLNIQPEKEEESCPSQVSDIGIMRLVQESTHRYIRQQKLSINGGNC
ncbi:hypothetical protein LXL04_027192 [Taraxacum kok-saghyz]